MECKWSTCYCKKRIYWYIRRKLDAGLLCFLQKLNCKESNWLIMPGIIITGTMPEKKGLIYGTAIFTKYEPLKFSMASTRKNMIKRTSNQHLLAILNYYVVTLLLLLPIRPKQSSRFRRIEWQGFWFHWFILAKLGPWKARYFLRV